MKEDSFYVQWHILDRCNLRCVHCYQDSFSTERELDWPKLRRAADNLLDTMASWGTMLDAAVTGGEPFLKPELMDILRCLDRSPLVGNISIISNGTIMPGYAHELSELSKLQEIRVSLDGIGKETNDAIRGKGVLAKVLKNIRQWQDVGTEVTIMFTLMRRNRRDIPYLTAFAKSLGVKGIIIERFFPIGRAKEAAQEMLTGQEFLEVWLEILKQEGMTADPEDLLPYRAIQVRLDDPEVDILGSGCVVAKDGMALLPDGTVLPCRRFPLPLGNIMEKPLHEIWAHSPVLAALSDKTRLKGRCGTCPVAACRGCRAMCFCLENDLLAEDPHCWL